LTSGKSVLASLVVDACSRISSSTVYFYFKQGDPEKRTFISMARSILRQLLLLDETLLLYLFDLSIEKGERTLGTIKTAKEALQTCLRAVGATRVIIDGLDECRENEQEQVARFWLDFTKASNSSAQSSSRCMLVSRDDEVTRPLFCKLPMIRVRGSGHARDIHTYCLARAGELQQDFQIDDTETATLAEETSSRASGMFLFARLVMDNLSQQVTKQDLRDEMMPGVFPSKLNEVYVHLSYIILRQVR
jgi:hypothetical protein